MENDQEAEIPDYGERKRTPAFIPATQLHLRGPLSLAEAKKAPVIQLEASDGNAVGKKLHAA